MVGSCSVLYRKMDVEMDCASCVFLFRHEVEDTGTQVLQQHGYHPEAILYRRSAVQRFSGSTAISISVMISGTKSLVVTQPHFDM